MQKHVVTIHVTNEQGKVLMQAYKTHTLTEAVEKAVQDHATLTQRLKNIGYSCVAQQGLRKAQQGDQCGAILHRDA